MSHFVPFLSITFLELRKKIVYKEKKESFQVWWKAGDKFVSSDENLFR